jgi:hypothetical protein
MPRRPGDVADRPPLLENPVRLREPHESAAFESGEPVLDEWLRQRALANLQPTASRTYVV